MRKAYLRALPRARSVRLVIHDLPGETLVYDLQNHKAFCLNETAGRIWKACDGASSTAGIARALGSPPQAVHHGLVQLARSGLLEERPSWLTEPGGLTRRAWLRTARKAAVALLPLVSTLAVATAAQAAGSCACNGATTGKPCQGCVGCCGKNCTKRCIGTGNCGGSC